MAAMKTIKAVVEPCPIMEELSDKIRKGEPVSMTDACAVIEYQQFRRSQMPNLWRRICRFFKPIPRE